MKTQAQVEALQSLVVILQQLGVASSEILTIEKTLAWVLS